MNVGTEIDGKAMIQEEIAMQISQHLREIRKSKKITLDELAKRAHVSKSLISQVENNRTIPSLLVLICLIQSLGMDVNEFFSDIGTMVPESKVMVRKRQDYKTFEKEPAKGFHYQRILTKGVGGQPVDFVLLELEPGADRPKAIRTDAYEFKYIIAGQVEYTIGQETFLLETGDSIFFDASQPHKPKNRGNSLAVMLIVYFFRENTAT